MSPVWDTAYALFALGEAGVPATDSRLVKCADWILQKQVRKPGDWKIKNPKGEPGGWYFEFNNEFYPDVDDSAMVCLALSRVEHPNGRYQRESVQRAIDWVLSMQCKDGGWASFDKDNDRMVFQYVPFADHNGNRRYHGPNSGVSCDLWIRSEPSGGEAGAQVYSQAARAGRKLVRTLGRQLYLRHDASSARLGSDERRSQRTHGSAGGRVDAIGAESGWWLGRDGGIL
jgi:hypothetical protein